MEIFLQATDILQFAVRIEEDGEIFYRKAALKAGDKGVRKFFNDLADEETGHKKTFQNMLSKIGEHRPPESFQGEYIANLRDYIDNKAVFTKDAANQQLSDTGDISSAISFAMQRELDSILYYQETRQFLSERHHGAIDSIIEEERKHFTNLAEMLTKINGNTVK
ncbi:MAG: ferritin family protein [Proteobacteria bacterium]|nr:ferritin family protein [Pseudomonadota bacterium]